MESTVSVKNDTDPSTKKSGPFDSLFIGKVKFATPTQRQRLPLSALFSQAFVVQPNPTDEEGLVNVRWVQMKSPLFIVRKTKESKTSLRRNHPRPVMTVRPHSI
jgi:hypothetical protein